jgi:hypothetical protein
VRHYLLFPVLACTLALSCSLSPLETAGGSTSTPNERVTGAILFPTGAPASRTMVQLIPSTYDGIKNVSSISLSTDTTDENGVYSFSKVNSGSFNIQAVHIDMRTRAFIAGIGPGADTVRVPSAVLAPAGTLRITLPDSIDPVNGYLFIPGTTITQSIHGASNVVVIDSVPAGSFPAIAYSSTTSSDANIVRYNIPVASNTATIVDNPSWKYARRLFLNTSLSGAAVNGDVVNFPVLVRLDGGNFIFDQANERGDDIRFTKPDNTPLPHQIERWNPAMSLAEIWINIDTVHGNDSTQYVMMYWGNPGAHDTSNSLKVFDTAGGFQGVWHLGQQGNTTAFDATANHYDGTPHGMNVSSSVEGMIGGAQQFDGASSYISLAGTASGKLSFPQNGTYTLSAWVYTEVIDSQAHYIISKSNKNYNLDLSSYNFWEIYDIRNGVGCESNFTPPHLKQWKYLTGVRNGSDQRVYVDGICVDSMITLTSGITVRDSTFDVQIGKRAESAYGYWNGIIDEVTIANVSRSADWIRLCYMNQRKENKLVESK